MKTIKDLLRKYDVIYNRGTSSASPTDTAAVTLHGDYGFSPETLYDYYLQELSKRELATLDAEPVEVEDESTGIIDWFVELGHNAADTWRTFFKKKDEVKLSNLQEQVRSGEASYINDINLAKQYLELKLELSDLLRQDTTNWSDSLKTAAELRIAEVLSTTKLIEDGVNQLDDDGNVIYHLEGLKSLARTNPYLQDIFYETEPGKLMWGNDKFGLFDLLKSISYDWIADNYEFSDWNPFNNFKHMLASDGIQLPFFGRTHRLSPELIQYMWDSKNTDGNLRKQVDAINDAERVVNARLADKNQQIQQIQHALKHGNWIYDPQKISPEYASKQEHNDIKLTSPVSWLYALPELGTSYSEWETMLKQYGVSLAFRGAAKAALAAGSGGVAPLLLAAAETATQAAITNYMRTLETNSEVFDAFSQRVLLDVDENKINLPNVIESSKDQLKLRGFDVDSMTDFEIMLNILSQNIVTDDGRFNTVASEASKGLDVVRLTNLALMTSDLAEGMYMFGGRYLKGWFGTQRLRNMAGKTLGDRATAELTQATADRLAKTLLNKAANGVIDRTIAKAVDKVWKSPGAKVMAYDAIKNIKDIGKRLGVSYFLEKTEEGQLGVVSSYYNRGKYDNVGNYSFLDGLANDFSVGKDAWLAYYGLSPDDTLNSDANLRKAMDIGGFTGLFMSGTFSLPDVYKSTRQALTDNSLRAYIADGYGDAEKSNKIELFMTADNNRRGGYDRIRHNLETLKLFNKPEGITDEMIDEDISLVNNISRLSSNKRLRKITNQLNIDRDSEEFIQVVKNAISIQDRLKDSQKASERSTLEIDEILNRIQNDEDLQDEIKQWYQDYLKQMKRKRSLARNTVVSKLPASVIENSTKAELHNIVEERLGEFTPLTEELYTKEVMARMVAIQDYNDLVQLRDELIKRKLDLLALKTDKNLDVNIDGISGILKYIEAQLEERKKIMRKLTGLDDVHDQVIDSGFTTSYKEELTKANMAKYVNDGIRADLMAHAMAYTLGRYVGDTRMYRPTFNTLTPEQQNAILATAALEDLTKGVARTRAQVIKEYDDNVNLLWDNDDKLADQESVQEKRALAVIQYDLKNRKQQEEVSRQENNEDSGDLVPMLDGEEPIVPPLDPGTPSEPEESSQSGTETPTRAPIPPQDSMVEQPQPIAALDELDKVVNGDPSLIPLIDPDSDHSSDEVESEESTNTDLNLSIADKIRNENPTEVISSGSEPSNVSEEVPAGSLIDTFSEESQGQGQDLQPALTEEPAPDAGLLTQPEIESEPENLAEPQPENFEQGVLALPESKQPGESQGTQDDSAADTEESGTDILDTPQAESIIPTVENPINAIDSSDTPNAADLMSDRDGNVAIVPNGRVDLARTISGEIPLAQQLFEEYSDSLSFGPSKDQNERRYESSKKTYKVRHVKDTFFYQPQTEEVMPIQVVTRDAKTGLYVYTDMIFTDKNGNPIERRPGSELAEKLATPGWLSTIDDAYFVVSAYAGAPSHEIYREGAIHLMIEKDGKLYNTELRSETGALKELAKSGVSLNDALYNLLLIELQELRTKIIESYAPDLKLPVVARKHVKPVPGQLRISNGRLNNLKDPAGRPIFRLLTEVGDFLISSDPIGLSRQILEGELQFGYGTGPFGETPYSINDMSTQQRAEIETEDGDVAFVNGEGYAGKIYFIPLKKRTPSGTSTLPIMLSEELHRINGVSRSDDIKLGFDAKGLRLRDENGKLVPLTTAELIFDIMTGTFDFMGLANKPFVDFILDLLANTGKKTLTFGLEGNDRLKYNFLVRKQLAVTEDEKGRKYFVNGSSLVGGERIARTETGFLTVNTYATRSTLLSRLTDNVKRQIIFEISNNIHWNTDKNIWMNSFPDDFVKNFVKIWENWRKNNPGLKIDANTLMPLLGCNELTMSLNDLGYTLDENGNPVKISDLTPIVMSWAITHGIIKTDLGEHAFYAPYVYCNQVAVDEEVKQRQDASAQQAKKPTTPAQSLPQQPSQEPQMPDISNYKQDDLYLAVNTSQGMNRLGDIKLWSKKTVDFRGLVGRGEKPNEEHWGEYNGLYYYYRPYKSGRGGDNFTIWFRFKPTQEVKDAVDEVLKSNSFDYDKITAAIKNSAKTLTKAPEAPAKPQPQAQPEQQLLGVQNQPAYELWMPTESLSGFRTRFYYPENSWLPNNSAYLDIRQHVNGRNPGWSYMDYKGTRLYFYYTPMPVTEKNARLGDVLLVWFRFEPTDPVKRLIESIYNGHRPNDAELALITEAVKNSMKQPASQLPQALQPELEKPASKPNAAAQSLIRLKLKTKAEQDQLLKQYNLQLPENMHAGNGMEWVICSRNGKWEVFLAPTRMLDRKFGGLKSTVRGSGNVDIEAAKKWLAEKLGIDQDEIFVTGQLVQYGQEGAYGMFNVIMDTLTNELMPQISLSRLSGRGVEYHEGFHYVTLLLLTEQQRNQLYQEYVKAHRDASTLTKEEVEERLAEEFRNYVLDQNRTGLLYKTLKFFRKLWNAIRFWNSHRSTINSFFKNINSGEYRKYKPTSEALQEFYDKHKGLAYYVPGLSLDEAAKMSNITEPDVFYHAVNSLTNCALTIYNIRTIEDVNRLNTQALFDMLQQYLDIGLIQKLYVDIVEDVVNNKDIFTRYVRNKLKLLGIREVEKADTEDNNKAEIETGDQPDNIWDRNQGEISKKDNISFRAKLFFYSIPKYEYVFNTDEETGVTTRDFVPVYDDIFQLQVTESFDYVWNQIMENLWDIDSYQDIVSRSAELGEAIPLFKALYNILTSTEAPISETTKTLLEVTIKSSKVQLDTLQVRHPQMPAKSKYDPSVSEEEKQYMADMNSKRFDWIVLDSDNLRKSSRLPARWSKAFFASSAVERDSKGNPYITKDVANLLSKTRNNITSCFKAIERILNAAEKRKQPLDSLSVKEIDEYTKEIEASTLQIFHAISIPMDPRTLQYMLNTFLRPGPKYQLLKDFWNGKTKDWDGKSKGKGEYPKYTKFSQIIATIIDAGRTGRRGIKSTSGLNVRTFDRMFTFGRGTNNQMAAIAISYGKMHPSQQEFCVVGADGSLIYPISENNYMTDQIRNINKNANGKRELILRTPFSAHSLIANSQTPLKLHTFLMLDMEDGGRDYFDITPVEDYIAKLTLTNNSRIILPTMADKKTWYSISGIKLVKDLLASRGEEEIDITDAYAAAFDQTSEQNATGADRIKNIPRRFSDETLRIFANYLFDEFNAVWDYFNKKDYVAKHPTMRVDNYHGLIKDGKMDHTGNGGRFRYFTALPYSIGALDGTILKGTIYVNRELARLELYGTTLEVLSFLQNLKAFLIGKDPNSKGEVSDNAPIFDIVNTLLMDATEREMKKLDKMGILSRDARTGLYLNRLIPDNIVAEYQKRFDEIQRYYNTSEGLAQRQQDLLYSIIGSHVANYAISVMEVEKCFTGDPAYYKWVKRKSKFKDKGSVEVITGKDVDKIKRLSAVLSTGTNLRTIWDNPEENDTKITVMHIADNKVNSDSYNALKDIFRNSILRDFYSEKHPKLTDDEVIKQLASKEKEDEFYANELSEEQRKFVDKYTESMIKPYGDGEINQTDAAVYIRPAMYRRIMRALGLWSDLIEEAYQLIEGDDETWLNDLALYQKAMSMLVKPLKMVYFGDHRDSQLNLNIPVFDKMAIFPLFKVMAKADNRALYDRMNNEELGVIDMVTFESAVKVGGRTKYKAYTDALNTEFDVESLNKKSFNLTKKEGDLPVFELDIRNLRLQLNTDPHKATDRSFGTQAAKICFANILDGRHYGLNKGEDKTGKQIKRETIAAINRLSDIGFNNVRRRFFDKTGKLKSKALSDYLISLAQDAGMSYEFISGLSIDADGNIRVPLAAQSIRQWVESRIISYINKEVVDINTPGGSAIQMPYFGFKATGARKLAAVGNAFNNGNKLRFLNDDGSMDVMLSINFFRHIVPKEHLISYGAMKKWLIDHNIIGENAKPQGLGYRIPTQGLSSTFSIKVVDVLPDRFGDTIIVPDEFTALTGSDFDVDKIYIAMLNYDEEGNIIQFNGDNIKELSLEALLNRIIQNFLLVVSDLKNMAETRASIDVLTNILKTEILPLIVPDNGDTEADPFYELLPSFLSSRKAEYSSGKSGIAPFALNSTNHCLTLLTHLQMNYSGNNKENYQLGELDAIKDNNGLEQFRILDWLSAMINAHVDVAKDPYIMQLNVNRVTYNMTSFLLRTGKGKLTFYFLAQPILKAFANIRLNSYGVYGVDPNVTERNIINSLYLTYIPLLRNAIDNLKDASEKLAWQKKFNGLLDELELSDKQLSKIKVQPYDEVIKGEELGIDRSAVFNETRLRHALKHIKANDASFLYQQLIVLRAYSELNEDSKALNRLVLTSLIDTKKFGNSLALELNFLNSYEDFINAYSDKFKIAGKSEEQVKNALKYYFDTTFLSKKLNNAVNLARMILKSLTFPATKAYLNIFNSVMYSMFGGDLITGTKGNEIIAYKHQSDKKLVQFINNAIENIIRARATRHTEFLLMTDDEFKNMFIGKNSMCSRLTYIKWMITNPDNRHLFRDLVDEEGNIKNELLNYLQEYPSTNENEQYGIDRIVLSESSMNNDYDMENQLISAFAQLLEHPDDDVRKFAEDLVKYAYYTSYDSRGVNSFFHLVPLQYKIDHGYVNNISEVLQSFANGATEAGYDHVAELGDDPLSMSFPSIRVTIMRNLWDNINLVPRIKLDLMPNTNDTDFARGKSFDRVLAQHPGRANGKPVQYKDLVALIPSKTKNKEFVTIDNGNTSTNAVELYQLVGKITYVDQEGKERSGFGTRFIYRRIPKLGTKSNGFTIYEFAKSGLDVSALPQNAFDSKHEYSDEDIQNIALAKTNTNKRAAEAGYEKVFIPNDSKDNIQIKSESTSRQLNEDPAEVSPTDTSFGDTPLTDADFGGPDVSNFVNITLANDTEIASEAPSAINFDSSPAIEMITQLLLSFDSMQDNFSKSDDAFAMLNTQQLADSNAGIDIGGAQTIDETPGLAEMGKKRKKECK